MQYESTVNSIHTNSEISENLTHRIFSYLLSPVRLSSVKFVRPTQAVQIFGNISTALGTLAIHWHPLKISRRSSQENLSTGGVKHKRGSQVSTAISRKRCKIGGKLVLITNRKSYMSFRLVPKSVTSNDLERRNGHYFALFQRIRVASGCTA